MYIMEGIARPERLPGDLYSRHILYVDSEADFGLYQDQYDQKGQLFINYTSYLKYADRVTPASRVAIYPFKRLFQTGSSSCDVQSVSRPSLTTRGTTCPRRSAGTSTWARWTSPSSILTRW